MLMLKLFVKNLKIIRISHFLPSPKKDKVFKDESSF